MKQNVFDVLSERGFIKQTVYEDELKAKLSTESVCFYVGFDPTADSLHIGHYIPIMAMAHMQAHGHRPIALIGGGTAMIGDPSNRSDMRSMMTLETVQANSAAFKEQMKRFIRFEGENAAVMDNNAEWLLKLNYVDFLRDIGVHFSVNKMLTADCFKTRLEKGLSFLEFNYMLMQGYDFLVLHNKYGCSLQLGGNDQWSNMLAGADLIRRKESKDAFCMTLALLENSQGVKMGKTSKGALWLDKNKTPPYDFYQYFRNVEDEKVEECFKLLTFMPLDEIAALTKNKDERINKAKERLAFEITKIIHGADIAAECQSQARAAFSGNTDDMETVKIAFDSMTPVVDLMVACGAAESKGAARRLVEGGGVSINDTKVISPICSVHDIVKDSKIFVLHKGKKTHIKIELV